MYDIVKDVIASVAGSAACVYCGQPFDTIKVRMQVQSHMFNSTFQCLRTTIAKEGTLSFFLSFFLFFFFFFFFFLLFSVPLNLILLLLFLLRAVGSVARKSACSNGLSRRERRRLRSQRPIKKILLLSRELFFFSAHAAVPHRRSDWILLRDCALSLRCGQMSRPATQTIES